MSASSSSSYIGRCLCGKVTFEMHAEPLFVSCCHCSNCKRYTGTVFTTNVVFPSNVSSHKIVTGADLVKTYVDEAQDSGNALPRHFCLNCGSPLFNTNGDFGRTMAVFSSALEGFEHHKPEIEYYTKGRVQWLPEFGGTQVAQTKPGRSDE
ncbi:Mss4-like protein [Hysterangium stoloniferum]|nr:Mss4-like protein [Hysterangium stoloniferum]